jgi:hypothetical protein
MVLLATLIGVVTATGTITFLASGRRLRNRTKLLRPSLAVSTDWSAARVEIAASATGLDGVGAQWREAGRTEHASVAAFAHLTLELMQLGAPPALLANAQRDALDEVRHAELCFSVARAIDGRAQGPLPFPPARARPLVASREVALVRLAVDALTEGALHAGFSARLHSKVSARCDDSGILATLSELAADEGRHSRHGWDVVDWCIAEGGAPIIRALRSAALGLPTKASTEGPGVAASGAWEKYGIPGVLLEAETYAEARREVMDRVEAASRVAN